MSLILCESEQLTVHPLLAPLPPLAFDAPEMCALIESIEMHGILRPVIVNDRREIMDDEGRSTVRAAGKAGLLEVPCVERPDEDAASIILSALCARRHLTKSALAYLAFPLMEAGRKARRAIQIRSLLAGKTARAYHDDTHGETVEQIADKLGFARVEYFRARNVAGHFAKHPEYRALMEPRILAGEASLHGTLAGLDSWLKGGAPEAALDKRAQHGRLVVDHFRRATLQFKNHWLRMDDEERFLVLKAAAEAALAWPDEVHDAIRRAVRNAKKGDV